MEESEGIPKNGKVISAGTGQRVAVLIGIVSLFADMIPEGTRSINGSHLAQESIMRAAIGNMVSTERLSSPRSRFSIPSKNKSDE